LCVILDRQRCEPPSAVAVYLIHLCSSRWCGQPFFLRGRSGGTPPIYLDIASNLFSLVAVIRMRQNCLRWRLKNAPRGHWDSLCLCLSGLSYLIPLWVKLYAAAFLPFVLLTVRRLASPSRDASVICAALIFRGPTRQHYAAFPPRTAFLACICFTCAPSPPVPLYPQPAACSFCFRAAPAAVLLPTWWTLTAA